MSKFNFLKKIGILGSIACALTGCGFKPEANIEPDVYGPPAMEDNYDIDDNNGDVIEEETDSVEDFNVSENEMQCIYGPPEMFEESAEDFNPEVNIQDEVYGPPSEDLINE